MRYDNFYNDYSHECEKYNNMYNKIENRTPYTSFDLQKLYHERNKANCYMKELLHVSSFPVASCLVSFCTILLSGITLLFSIYLPNFSVLSSSIKNLEQKVEITTQVVSELSNIFFGVMAGVFVLFGFVLFGSFFLHIRATSKLKKATILLDFINKEIQKKEKLEIKISQVIMPANSNNGTIHLGMQNVDIIISEDHKIVIS